MTKSARREPRKSAGRDIESYPIRLFAQDMADIFDVSLKRFYALAAEGAFDFAKNRPTIGRKSWSRDRVKAYFEGTLVGPHTGRAHGRHGLG